MFGQKLKTTEGNASVLAPDGKRGYFKNVFIERCFHLEQVDPLKGKVFVGW
jgi:hypothetical protein